MRRSVRCLMSLILIIAFMLTLAGCGEKPEPKEGETKEELVIALDRYSAGKKPPEGIGAAECTQIYEPLLFLNHKLEIQPGLVTSWERIDDLNWSLKLREGVNFHNGKEFDAEAAKFAFTMNLDRKSNVSQRVKEVVSQDSFKIVDKHTLEIKTIKPYPFFPTLMTLLNVVEPEAFNKGEIVGTGAYKFKEEITDEQVTVERNDDFWGKKPFFKRVVFKTVPDQNTRVMALKTGDVDMALYPALPSLNDLKKEYTVFYGFKGLPFLTFNYEKAYCQDVNFRKALGMAADKEKIAKEIYYGTADPANSLIPKELLYSIEGEYKGSSYDTAQAKELLKEAGYKDSDNDGYVDKDGKNLDLKFVYWAEDQWYKSIAETIASNLKDSGVKTNIIAVDAAAWNEVVLEKGDYDFCLNATGVFWGGSSTMLYDQFYSKSGLTGFDRLNDAEIDKLIEEGMELESKNDIKEAAEKYKAAQRRAINELVIVYPLAFEKHVVVAKKNVKNFSPFPHYWMFYEGCSENLLGEIKWED
ncbi:MAG: ABC transporter substrate-binding protein [Syntrophaceticus sp.]|nr:ABC transporter substrate-binding protein [Syntrophaceticus sp.]MDD4783710.1 ABC transporter substrate-binding protein [Syntrophaceticus sp.]